MSMNDDDNDVLKVFYLDIQKWIDDGLPESKVFYKYYGLCPNMFMWLCDLGMGDQVGHYKHLLGKSFESAGLSYYAPFNAGNSWDYRKEYVEHTMYENPLRLEWVRKHATE